VSQCVTHAIFIIRLLYLLDIMDKYIDGHKQFHTAEKAKTTAEYVVARLVDLGIQHAFSVPGDFSFTIDRALINHPHLKNIVAANELNASYAADAYARVRGAAILSTTYAVGELCAINGVMGAKAENNVIFHLVGSPSDAAIAKSRVVHHTLGDGDYQIFSQLSAASACVSTRITPDNAVSEMNRVIKQAFKFRQPAYIILGLEDGRLPLSDQAQEEIYHPMKSDPQQLKKALDLLSSRLKNAKKVVAIASVKLDRFNCTKEALELIEKLDIPFVIMPHDKSVISEHHSNYAGYYCGLLSDPKTAEIVESADLVINLGDAFWSDFNTGGFTNNLDMHKVINLAPFFVEDHQYRFSHVSLCDLLQEVSKRFPKISYKPQYVKPRLNKIEATGAALSLKFFYSHFIHFLEKNDVLVIETGSSSVNMAKLPLPEGVKYHNQTLWGSIGWATPATLGVCLGKADKRCILVTGDGSHQLTLNELGVMGRYQVNPIIFCLNNQGFTVERALETEPFPSYDDIAPLDYVKLPQAFGCKNWLSLRIKTEQELVDALKQARLHPNGVYIELILDKLDYGSSLEFYHQHLKSLYA